jgi:hypothetical protein
MAEQLKQNRNWGAIARDMITAEGGCRFDDDGNLVLDGSGILLVASDGHGLQTSGR